MKQYSQARDYLVVAEREHHRHQHRRGVREQDAGGEQAQEEHAQGGGEQALGTGERRGERIDDGRRDRCRGNDVGLLVLVLDGKNGCRLRGDRDLRLALTLTNLLREGGTFRESSVGFVEVAIDLLAAFRLGAAKLRSVGVEIDHTRRKLRGKSDVLSEQVSEVLHQLAQYDAHLRGVGSADVAEDEEERAVNVLAQILADLSETRVSASTGLDGRGQALALRADLHQQLGVARVGELVTELLQARNLSTKTSGELLQAGNLVELHGQKPASLSQEDNDASQV